MLTKQELRKQALEVRKKIPLDEKRDLDRKIFENLVNFAEFSKAKLILTYFSTELEIDTKQIIDFALKCGKIVAIPRCNAQNQLDFYKILDFTNLIETKMGIIEPIANPEHKVNDFNHSICITPGLGFDKFGHRIGYGKGFYDKFLANYTQKSIGLCYNSNVIDKILHDDFDKPVDMIATERKILTKNF